MLQEIDTDLDAVGVTSRIIHKEVSIPQPVVTGTIVRSERTAYMATSDDQWSWQDLRDYVFREIESRFGPQPRDPKIEAGIFKGFIGRWGADAAAIARHAFEVADGYWKGAPISRSRFTQNCDPYFAQPIAERLGITAS